MQHPTNPPRIMTSRFTLRGIQREDEEALHQIWTDPRVDRYFSMEHFESRQETRAMIALLSSLWGGDEGCRWSILDNQTGQIAGTCGFHKVAPQHHRAELGYELAPSFWGRGLMQEVIGAVLDYCFNDRDFNRIEAFVTAGNERSARTLLSAGFTLEGTLRQYEFARGQFVDHWLFSVLRSEWLGPRRD